MTTLSLDINRELRWTMRAEFRLGSLPTPPSFSDLASKNTRKAFHALCCMVWACVVSDSAFAGPGRSYPVENKSHAANAKARASQMEKAGKLSPSSKARIDAKANRVLGK